MIFEFNILTFTYLTLISLTYVIKRKYSQKITIIEFLNLFYIVHFKFHIMETDNIWFRKERRRYTQPERETVINYIKYHGNNNKVNKSI